MRARPRRTWTMAQYAILALLLGAGAWFNRQPLGDILAVGWRDEENSHIFLAPIVALWLLWLRRSRFRYAALRPSLLGPMLVAGAAVVSWWGFERGVQVAWHGGAILSLLGLMISMTGIMPLRLFGPVFIVLLFLLPVPGELRHRMAMPMQEMATSVTHGLLELMGVSSVKSGNVLVINNEQVAVGEACNGMRLVLALTLVVYAFAFGTPLKPGARLTLLALSPIIAIACNVIRLVPTSLIYGFGDRETARTFHDLAGWAMLVLALAILWAVLRTFRWLEFPVSSFRLASQ